MCAECFSKGDRTERNFKMLYMFILSKWIFLTCLLWILFILTIKLNSFKKSSAFVTFLDASYWELFFLRVLPFSFLYFLVDFLRGRQRYMWVQAWLPLGFFLVVPCGLHSDVSSSFASFFFTSVSNFLSSSPFASTPSLSLHLPLFVGLELVAFTLASSSSDDWCWCLFLGLDGRLRCSLSSWCISSSSATASLCSGCGVGTGVGHVASFSSVLRVFDLKLWKLSFSVSLTSSSLTWSCGSPSTWSFCVSPENSGVSVSADTTPFADSSSSPSLTWDSYVSAEELATAGKGSSLPVNKSVSELLLSELHCSSASCVWAVGEETWTLLWKPGFSLLRGVSWSGFVADCAPRLISSSSCVVAPEVSSSAGIASLEMTEGCTGCCLSSSEDW